MYHPNVDVAGRICLDLLRLPPKGTWRPVITLSGLLTSLQMLLAQPNPDDPLMADIVSAQISYVLLFWILWTLLNWCSLNQFSSINSFNWFSWLQLMIIIWSSGRLFPVISFDEYNIYIFIVFPSIMWCTNDQYRLWFLIWHGQRWWNESKYFFSSGFELNI